MAMGQIQIARAGAKFPFVDRCLRIMIQPLARPSRDSYLLRSDQGVRLERILGKLEVVFAIPAVKQELPAARIADSQLLSDQAALRKNLLIKVNLQSLSRSPSRAKTQSNFRSAVRHLPFGRSDQSPNLLGRGDEALIDHELEKRRLLGPCNQLGSRWNETKRFHPHGTNVAVGIRDRLFDLRGGEHHPIGSPRHFGRQAEGENAPNEKNADAPE